MAQWRYKPAGSFPTSFHNAMTAGEGVDKLVLQVHTAAAAERMQVEFRIFRYSLRFDKSHPTAHYERTLSHRTRVWYNPQNQLWELLLTSRKSVLEDMEILP